MRSVVVILKVKYWVIVVWYKRGKFLEVVTIVQDVYL